MGAAGGTQSDSQAFQMPLQSPQDSALGLSQVVGHLQDSPSNPTLPLGDHISLSKAFL